MPRTPVSCGGWLSWTSVTRERLYNNHVRGRKRLVECLCLPLWKRKVHCYLWKCSGSDNCCCDNTSATNTPQLTYNDSRSIRITLNEQYIITITKYLLKGPMNCMGWRLWNGKRSFEMRLKGRSEITDFLPQWTKYRTSTWGRYIIATSLNKLTSWTNNFLICLQQAEFKLCWWNRKHIVSNGLSHGNTKRRSSKWSTALNKKGRK